MKNDLNEFILKIKVFSRIVSLLNTVIYDKIMKGLTEIAQLSDINPIVIVEYLTCNYHFCY